jgi:ribonuclease P/MRP protein subunit RPP1
VGSKVNRAACEDHRVDILSKPYFKRRDCGINHVIARQAAQNQVAIELNIRHLTTTRPYLHYKILAHFREILKLQRKFGFPLIITRTAQSIYDLHTPEYQMALSKCLE